MHTKHGQAMIELAIGMLVLVMVVTLLCGFAVFMTKSIQAQNTARGKAKPNGDVVVDIRIGNATIRTMRVREHCLMPELTIVK